MVQTKLARVRELMAAGNEYEALRTVAKFGRLGAETEVIRRGLSAMLSPDFYRQLGYDPDTCVREALQAIRDRYNIPPA